MVIRGLGSCATCDHNFVIRAGVGIESYQRHCIDCSECGAPIVLAVRCRDSNAQFVVEENFSLESHEDHSATIVNLHPSFAFDPETFHSPMEFASLKYLARIQPVVQHLIPKGQKYTDVAFIFNIANTPHVWERVRRGLRLEESPNNEKHLTKTIDEYLKERRRYRPDTNVKDVNSMLTNFLHGAFFPQIDNIATPAIELLEKAKTDFTGEFSAFKSYYLEKFASEQKHSFISVFSDYFRNYTQYSQMLIHARLGDEAPGAKVVGSKAFEEIKLYYGQAYETLTTSFMIFACLNNILSGRSYDEFKHMNLNKYIKDLEKSKKANPFIDIPQFCIFTKGLDSSLRNGSHHASIWRKGDVVYYRSGGTGTERNIPFSDYLHSCNQLTVSLAALWLLERNLLDE